MTEAQWLALIRVHHRRQHRLESTWRLQQKWCTDRLNDMNQRQAQLHDALFDESRRISDHHQLLRPGSTVTPAALMAAHQMVERSQVRSDKAKDESIKAKAAFTSAHLQLHQTNQQRAVLDWRKKWADGCLESHRCIERIAAEAVEDDDVQDLGLWCRHLSR